MKLTLSRQLLGSWHFDGIDEITASIPPAIYFDELSTTSLLTCLN